MIVMISRHIVVSVVIPVEANEIKEKYIYL